MSFINETSPLKYNDSGIDHINYHRKHRRKHRTKKHRKSSSSLSDPLIPEPSSNDKTECYICYEPVLDTQDFIPCNCRFGKVHKKCIEYWIDKGNITCRICNTTYNATKNKSSFKKYFKLITLSVLGIIFFPITFIIFVFICH